MYAFLNFEFLVKGAGGVALFWRSENGLREGQGEWGRQENAYLGACLEGAEQIW